MQPEKILHQLYNNNNIKGYKYKLADGIRKVGSSDFERKCTCNQLLRKRASLVLGEALDARCIV